MKARKTHHHTVGRYTFQGATKGEARQAFEAALASYCGEDRTVDVENRFGSVFIIWRDLNGFNVRTIWHESVCGEAFEHSHTFTWPSCSDGTDSFDAVLASARLHCAQNHWTRDTDDDSHVAAAGLELRGE